MQLNQISEQAFLGQLMTAIGTRMEGLHYRTLIQQLQAEKKQLEQKIAEFEAELKQKAELEIDNATDIRSTEKPAGE